MRTWLAWFSSAPTQRHWNDILTIFRYLKGTIDMGLFYPYRELRQYGKMGEGSMFAAADRPVVDLVSTGRWSYADRSPTPVDRSLTAENPLQSYSLFWLVFADVGYLSDPCRAILEVYGTDLCRYFFEACWDYYSPWTSFVCVYG
jgi:hypothetical protein